MVSLKLTPNQINISIVPTRVLYPERSVAPVLAKAHDCVDALHAVVRKVDRSCSDAEDDSELSASGIGRRRAEICDQALGTLVNFKALEIAEKALIESIDALERLSYGDPQQVQMHQTLTQARDDPREQALSSDANRMDRLCSSPSNPHQEEHTPCPLKRVVAVARTIGIDAGKNTLHMIGLDEKGANVLREKVSRNRITPCIGDVI
jgi:hypothetical protein